MDFLKLSEKYVNDALDDLAELVKIASVLDENKTSKEEPFGHENALAIAKMLEIGAKLGFLGKNVDNYAGHLSYGQGTEILGILGHLDVVPAVGSWTYGPFNPVISDGKMYGRGTLDDKGGVIASLYAMKLLKDEGFIPNKEIRLICGCDEESGSRCLEYYFKKEKMPESAFSPDADFPVIYGEKGIYNLTLKTIIDNSEVKNIEGGLRTNIVMDHAKLTVKNAKKEYLEEYLKKNPTVKAELVENTYHFYGVGCHASIPENGVNAAVFMFEFMDEYYPCEIASFITKYYDTNGKKLGIYTSDPEMHELTINLGVMKLEGKELSLFYNLRVPKDEHVPVINKGFIDAISTYGNIEFIAGNYSKSHFVAKESKLVSSLYQAFKDITGDTASKPYTIGGGTYARMMDNAVAFGPNLPGRADICHEPDEHIYVEDLVKWIAIYAESIYLLTK